MHRNQDDCTFMLSTYDPCQESWWMMKLPFCNELIWFDPIGKQIVFNGRYCLADKDFSGSAPNRMRIKVTYKGATIRMEIRITKVHQGKDKSTVDCIDRGMEICFFPSHVLTLDYELVETFTEDNFHKI